ncbi:MAG: hypothetical protein COU10_00430 [Candidatus Harrisonbacteria bacterium CG10_big_fil_rev_8_21_14_0_10_45_28]|uniref:Diacylglycerol kinase n=1 Tax=Candidatus Harrisonbacteria bacterium CG10_big_fil_rev_8_21_14_0_10_45_28 TaxID=1974586 RepID=A0A2H0UP66_9BACT|nr:MAG: hypothetical protein COU10_00430 [Candidatus Harrisonbacteria bacterium CG10_big_fil_rev_8_21_14_0_10_45_28]
MALMKKIGWALKGVKETFRTELNFKLEVFSGFFLAGFVYLAWPLSFAELAALLMAYTSALVLEMVNTSIEAALGRLHPEKHDLIGKAKDAAAGAVFLSVVLTFIIAGLILLNRFGVLVLR